MTGVGLFAGAVTVVSCVVSSDTVSRRVNKDDLLTYAVQTPVKAHLVDGSVIVYRNGVSIDARNIAGTGDRYDALRTGHAVFAGTVPLDSIIGFEVIERRPNPVRTILYSAGTLSAAALGSAVAAVVIFGSCPTIYGDSAGVETLQAESFSYSIAPLLGKRDIDRMTVQPDRDGIIRLHVRNEALETHRIDHIELVEVDHAPGELALPSPRGGAVVVGDIDTRPRVRDAGGRDVSREVRGHDALFFGSSNAALDSAITGGATEDQLVIAVPRRSATDSGALVLRARSSLLTTSVLYDHLIGRQGPRALDWMGRDLGRITSLAKLGQWYGANFGMRVEVETSNGWKPLIRLMDFGPTAWRSVGLALPLVESRDDSIRVRLSFPVDGFRIDQVAIAHAVRRPEQRLIPLARVIGRGGDARPDMREHLRAADGRDVETYPGQQFTIEFDAGQRAGARTFFYASQGYYVEWVRPSWMKRHGAAPFDPGPETMRQLLRDWRGGRDSLEMLFFRRRVPVL